MTMVQNWRGTEGDHEDAVLEEGASLEADLAELRRALADHPFPTQQDDLIAACLGRHEPARLCCRLATLTRTRTYDSLDEVLADVRAAALDPAAGG